MWMPAPIINTEQKPKRKRKVIIVTVIFFVVLIIIGFLKVISAKQAEAEQYYNNMRVVTYTMLEGAADAENAGNLIRSISFRIFIMISRSLIIDASEEVIFSAFIRLISWAAFRRTSGVSFA